VVVDLDRLAMSNEDVADLLRPDRERRVFDLMNESYDLLDEAIAIEEEHGKDIVGVVGLFSGGNDSTVLCHLMLSRMTHLAHANTTIGIEQTRQFVRDTAAEWGVPLLEFKPPNEKDWFRPLVLEQGFPGPGHHFKMFQRLKERGLRQVRRTLVTNSRQQRVVFLAGRRRTESKRRMNVVEMERVGSVVYVSPLVNWTKMDMNTYRLMQGNVPTNAVSDILHMSGECLCGSFAHSGELNEIAEWFPDVAEEIRSLEREIADREDIAERRKIWGWGADNPEKRPSKSPKVGVLCSSCDARWADQHEEHLVEQ
jgi:3'-phosphoadenosine 5'-phosphosulfate sulfotransferase (PAPS reductase)/FAD synthetase